MSANLLQFTPHFIIETTQVKLCFNKYSPLILTTPARRNQPNMILSNGQNEQSSNIGTPLPMPQDNSTGASVL
jgi:hypothetical protein